MDNIQSLVNTQKPATRVYIDYDYWYYSCVNMDPQKVLPDIVGFRRELEAHFKIDEIKIYGDFQGDIRGDLDRLRQITNSIIETHKANSYREKDITDFIMVDQIYQDAMEKNCGVYVIFSGDGHFQSVINFLKHRMDKKVIVCGVEGTFSASLKQCASEVRIYSKSEVLKQRYEKMILSNLAYCAAHPEINTTFLSTVNVIKKRNEDVSEENLRYTINKMINERFLFRAKKEVSPDLILPVILPDWDRIADCHMYDEALLPYDTLHSNT